MKKLVVDKDLTYYISTELYKRMQKGLLYLLEHPDGILQTKFCDTFKIPPLWIERMDKLGLIRIKSKWIGTQPNKLMRPWIYTIKIWNIPKAKKIINRNLDIKIVTKETEISDRINRLLDEKESENTNDEDS